MAVSDRPGPEDRVARHPLGDIDAGDLRAARGDLAGGCLDLVDVLFDLPEMRRQLLDPLVEPCHVLQHRLDLGLDDTGGLMHAGVAQDRPHRMQDQHQIVRPGHVDTAPAALIDKLGKLQIDLGIDRFRRKNMIALSAVSPGTI